MKIKKNYLKEIINYLPDQRSPYLNHNRVFEFEMLFYQNEFPLFDRLIKICNIHTLQFYITS